MISRKLRLGRQAGSGFISITSLMDGGELLRHANLVVWRGDCTYGGLTGNMAGSPGVEGRARQTQIPPVRCGVTNKRTDNGTGKDEIQGFSPLLCGAALK
jgi:hypothetical protein